MWFLLLSISTVFAQTDVGMVLDPGEVTELTKAQAGERSSLVAESGQRVLPQSEVTPHQTQQLAAVTAKTPTENTNTVPSKAPAVESFSSLDREAEKLLKEVLNLSSDLSILDEQHANPAKNQLLVLVTLQPSSFFELDYVELKVDNQVVAAHPYTEKEIGALLRGGGHRLYLANLPAGMHQLKAVFVGKVPRDPDYQREASFTFISGVDRTVIELYVNSVENNGFPQFTIKEYN